MSDLYGTCLEYIEKWKEADGGATSNLEWVLLRKTLERDETQISLKKILPLLELTTKDDFEETLFHQWNIAKKNIESKLDYWSSSGAPVSEIWERQFKVMNTETVCFTETAWVVELVLCFPRTMAPVSEYLRS